jgi:hypothetical protein
MLASLRPGGAIVLSDLASQVPPSGATAMQPLFAAFPQALHTGGGWDPDCGIQLAPRLEAAGVDDLCSELHSARVSGGSAGADWLSLSIGPLRTAFLATGLMDEIAVQAATQALNDPSVSFWLPPMISAWGKLDGHA